MARSGPWQAVSDGDERRSARPGSLRGQLCSLSSRVKQHWRLDSPINMVRAMAFLPLNELPALFPHVVDWISCLEKQAEESGRALTPIEFNLAQTVGLADPEEVRILSVRRIPLPSHPSVKQLARQVGVYAEFKPLH